jgi:hypothetical protein
MPGLGAALSSIGFGAILAFSALLFADRGWLPVWLPFSAFATSLIVARVLFGKLPDRLGGARVALVTVFVEAAGLAMGAYTAFLDVALGLGSPALGLIAGSAGLGAVFLASAVVVLGAALIALRLLSK